MSHHEYSVHQYDGSKLQANVNTNSGMYGEQGGEGNRIPISQSGSNATARVEQGSSMNSRAEIWQSGWEGQKMADVWQSGSGNQAMVNQHGGSSQASVHQAGSNLSASITQGSNGYGYGNSAHIRQGF
ncbi:MAG: Curlin associated repeat [Massilia sp.]|nr:Curlin associated repeat [Massilia sp.]MDB5791171.1 Curlin associated repeat [Massilia sp.]